MIHEELFLKLNKSAPDKIKIIKLLLSGRKATWSFNNYLMNKYDKIGITSQTEDKDTIFHLLAKKKLLGGVIDTVVSNAESIFDREKVNYKVADNQDKTIVAENTMFSLLLIKKQPWFEFIRRSG